jgi:hypothetical protein
MTDREAAIIQGVLDQAEREGLIEKTNEFRRGRDGRMQRVYRSLIYKGDGQDPGPGDGVSNSDLPVM